MRRLLLRSALPVVALLLCGCSGTSDEAACAQPELTSSSMEVRPGDRIAPNGKFFRDGCNDQGERGEPQPLKGQPVTWKQGASVVELARVDANTAGEIRTTVTVPSTAPAGTAEITVGLGGPFTITVRPS
jgi:hypothetical protein